jgi:flagellar basal-body rod modification protein FlgD
MAAGTSSATSTASGSSSSSNSATISANDFLTLLVTEMQNQDPTAATDPDEYINQLVQVNSLEQLIDINQTLSTDLGSTSSSSASGQATTSNSRVTANSVAGTGGQSLGSGQKSNLLSAIQSVASGRTAGRAESDLSARNTKVQGNLSIPEDRPAAHRVAHSLAGTPQAR